MSTSGGGFSTYYSQPIYQSEAVSQYFINAAAAGTTPTPGYNTYGRAYPDISFRGARYVVVVGGYGILLYGTSASSPVAAGISKCFDYKCF